jgi:hypothetical protein
VNSFSWRLNLGLRRDGPTVERDDDDDSGGEYSPEVVPSWTEKVPALSETLVLYADGDSPEFQRRNIIATSRYLRTI